MFDELAAVIDRTEVPVEGAAIAEALFLRDRLTAKVVDALGAFEAEDGWALDHEASLASWLRNQAGLTSRAARHLARSAKLLRQLPVTAAAFADGRLSGGQVDAILANVTERTVALFAEHEPDVVPSVAPLPTADVVQVMQLWKQRAEARLEDDEPPEEARELFLSPTLDGRWEGRIALDSDGGNVVRTALRLAETRDEDDVRSPARRRADALVDVCRHYLDTQRTTSGGRHRPHVNVVITLEELEQRHAGGRYLEAGGPVPASTVEALLCDCNIHRVVTDGAGTILDYGRSTRTVPVNLYQAVAIRDQHCRAWGCDVPADRCDTHHVHPWEDGGPTTIDNAVLKCPRHHHLHHRRGWSDKLLPDGTYIVTDPDGRTRTTRPPRMLDLDQAG